MMMKAGSGRKAMLAAALALGLAGCNVDGNGAVVASGQNLETIIRSYGFSRLNPASTLYPPGTLVALLNYDPANPIGASVELTYLCSLDYSVARYPATPVMSRGDGLNFIVNQGAQINLEVPALKNILDLSATAAVAETVKAKIVDVKFHAFAPNDLQAVRSGMGRDCRGSVNANVATQNAYQVDKVLEASIELQVTLKAGATAAAKAKALKELGKAGFTAMDGSAITIGGKSLYYGVHLVPVRHRL